MGIGWVGLLYGLVAFCLLLGTNRLLGTAPGVLQCGLGAVLSGIYAGLCMAGRLSGTGLELLTAQALVGAVAFGLGHLRHWALFLLLTLALGGLALLFGTGGPLAFLAAAGAVLVLGGLSRFRGERLVSVELQRAGKQVRLTALRDTGNNLTDPITGQPVLVIGPEAAQTLTGLTRQQLQAPTENLGALQGLRLIPFRTVGRERGFLLGLRFSKARVGGRAASVLVAFSPEEIGKDRDFNALTGGNG